MASLCKTIGQKRFKRVAGAAQEGNFAVVNCIKTTKKTETSSGRSHDLILWKLLLPLHITPERGERVNARDAPRYDARRDGTMPLVYAACEGWTSAHACSGWVPRNLDRGFCFRAFLAFLVGALG